MSLAEAIGYVLLGVVASVLGGTVFVYARDLFWAAEKHERFWKGEGYLPIRGRWLRWAVAVVIGVPGLVVLAYGVIILAGFALAGAVRLFNAALGR